MTIEKTIKDIRQLIANDDLPPALSKLQTLLENSPKLDEVIHQSGRFADIRKQIRLGTVSHENATLTRNQISIGILDLLDELKSQQEQPEIQEEINQAVLSIENSKNVVANSNITAGGDVHIGDQVSNTSKTITQNAEKIYNIEKIDKADFS